jgi:hypothetical protein
LSPGGGDTAEGGGGTGGEDTGGRISRREGAVKPPVFRSIENRRLSLLASHEEAQTNR